MEFYSGKIHTLIFNSQNGAGFWSKSFATKTLPAREKRFGKIFGFISIQSDDPKINLFIDYLIEQIKEHYSFGLKNEFAKRGVYDIEKIFETTLQKTNISIAQYLQTEKISLALNKMHVLIAVMRERNLYFTIQIGRASCRERV